MQKDPGLTDGRVLREGQGGEQGLKWEYLLVWCSWWGGVKTRIPPSWQSVPWANIGCSKTASERGSSCSERSVDWKEVRALCERELLEAAVFYTDSLSARTGVPHAQGSKSPLLTVKPVQSDLMKDINFMHSVHVVFEVFSFFFFLVPVQWMEQNGVFYWTTHSTKL